MSSNGERRKTRLLLRFFVVFMVALATPLVGGGVFFAFQIRSIEDGVLAANARSLSLFRQIVDSTSRQIDTALANLRQDPAFQLVMYMDYPLDLKRITDVASSHRTSLIGKVTDPYLIDLFAYFAGPRILFTQQQIFLDTTTFYPAFFQEMGYTHNEWLARFAPERYFGPELIARKVLYNGELRHALEFRYSLPPVPRIRNRGVVAALIDRDALASVIRQELIPQGGVALIRAADGTTVVEAASPDYGAAVATVIASVPTDSVSGVRYVRWESETIAVAYERSPEFGWTIVSAVPQNVFLEQSGRIVTLFVIVAVVVFLFGVPLSLLLAYRTSKPLSAMSDILRSGVVLPTEPSHRLDGLDTLSESVYALTQRHASLRELLDEEKPLVRQVIIDRLLRGDFPSENELLATLRHYEVEIVAPWYGVFAILIDGYYNEANDEVVHEFIVKSALVMEELGALLPDGSLLHSISLNRIAAVVSMESEDGDAAEHQIVDTASRIDRMMNARDDVRCFVASGPGVRRLYDVPESLRIAMFSVRNESADAAGKEHSSARESYYYPADLELRIVNLVEAGREEELARLLATVGEENFVHRSLSSRMVQALATEVEGTRNKILASIDISDLDKPDVRPAEVSTAEYVHHRLDDLRLLAKKVGEREGREHRFKKAILDYVDSHFSDPRLGLKRLALEFAFSEVYLSYLFRQMTGTTFSDYLEKRRTDEAADLLRTTSMTVNEVAEHVGYASAAVFRRAFKRRFGISPSGFMVAVSTPDRRP